MLNALNVLIGVHLTWYWLTTCSCCCWPWRLCTSLPAPLPLFRYIPVGLLEVTPQVVQWRPPAYRGRNELESLLGSESAADWVRISEMLLGPAPPGFSFSPKHKSNAYAASADAVGQAAGAAAAAGQQGGEAGEAAPAGAEEQENG